MGGHLDQKIALVTGGSRGIGRAIVQELASQGATVLINYAHDAAPAEALVAQIQAQGGRAWAYEANVADEDSVQSLFGRIGEQFERLDILVNNAGYGAMRPVADLPLRHFQRALDLNCRAILQCSQEAARLMSQPGGSGGKIINISSVGAGRVLPRYTAIGVSKAALEALTRYLAVELAPANIVVNAISSGPVQTDALHYFYNAERALVSALEQTPAGRLVVAQDVAQVVNFLCSEAAWMIRGQTLMVDGGLSLSIHVY